MQSSFCFHLTFFITVHIMPLVLSVFVCLKTISLYLVNSLPRYINKPTCWQSTFATYVK